MDTIVTHLSVIITRANGVRTAGEAGQVAWRIPAASAAGIVRSGPGAGRDVREGEDRNGSLVGGRRHRREQGTADLPGERRVAATNRPAPAARRFGALALAALAALALGVPEEAEAQTVTTFISNFGRTSSGTVELFNEQAGLGIFETGVSGATLTSIELQARGFNPVPSVTLYTGTVNTSTQEVTLDTEVATFTAPSSNLLDWFVGVSGLSLLDAQGEWLLPHQVDLFPYDAGTEEGTELSLSNPATSPQGMIASLKGTGKFSDQPIARLTFDLQLPVLAALRSCDKEKEHELHRE